MMEVGIGSRHSFKAEQARKIDLESKFGPGVEIYDQGNVEKARLQDLKPKRDSYRQQSTSALCSELEILEKRMKEIDGQMQDDL